MGIIVIVAYRPKQNQESALRTVLRKHVTILRNEGLATDRPVQVMRAKDGTFLETFEWKSAKAIEEAHRNPQVQAMWGEFNAACTYVPLAELEESKSLFAGFEPVEL